MTDPFYVLVGSMPTLLPVLSSLQLVGVNFILYRLTIRETKEQSMEGMGPNFVVRHSSPAKLRLGEVNQPREREVIKPRE